MSTYSQTHDALFRTVADILVRDYIAPSETADTVAEWCEVHSLMPPSMLSATDMGPSALAALIADVEGYERRQG